jgi:soluble lytic murein transglycosylase-like protein
MQVTLGAVEQVLFGGQPTTSAQQTIADNDYNELSDPEVNVLFGSSYLQWAVNTYGGFQGGLMNYTGGNSREVSDVQNCKNILNPNDPSTYQAAFAAATK